ncbi:hypothetical protein CA54_24030 [Symmachiella macrocystis]|uniref:Uncharacterized protein n=1 Tax=Symmachiella macrocystis TaxID=2527985 RepID=A0A5C6BNC8_9PLAN|nr:hypothetical protein [Symmachiella macrocystis]TWU13568.1 hypothetical protein CA54_24030 [Symmachiella macrocystis]
MADTTTQLPKTKRRARWPYLLAAVAVLAVISIMWLVPIAMEQRTIAVIRAECPKVDIMSGVVGDLPSSIEGLHYRVGSFWGLGPLPRRTLIRTGIAEPAIL